MFFVISPAGGFPGAASGFLLFESLLRSRKMGIFFLTLAANFSIFKENVYTTH